MPDSMIIIAHFIIHIQISIRVANNKDAFTLRNPCNRSATAANNSTEKSTGELTKIIRGDKHL